jgi:hypothetical protein
MTLQKTMPLVFVIFTVLCALPLAGAAVIPLSAFAQEEDDEDQNLVGGIVSNVLEGGNAEDESNQDATNTAAEDSNQGQDVDQDEISAFGDDSVDLDDTNLAVPIGIPINVQEVLEVVTPTLPEEEEEPPEFVAFCLVFTGPGGDTITGCFDTSEECEIAQEILVDLFPDTLISQCKGFVTLPANAADCNIVVDQEEEPIGFNCQEI